MILFGFLAAVFCLIMGWAFPLQRLDRGQDWRVMFPLGLFLSLIVTFVGLILQSLEGSA